MQKIVGSPGPNGFVIDQNRLAEFRDLMHRMDLADAIEDIADGYLTILPRKHRNGKGVYYTPQQVVEFILDQTLPPPRIGKLVDDPCPDGFRVLEPACGAGYFLLATYRIFRDSYKKAGIPVSEAVRLILTDRIAAIDIDTDAILVALGVLITGSWPRPRHRAGDRPDINTIV